jgi:hypothetical protein
MAPLLADLFCITGSPTGSLAKGSSEFQKYEHLIFQQKVEKASLLLLFLDRETALQKECMLT